ncbi:unnamed protein product [Rhizophagus irregularis]|nr:unnamed protein product [Rhizophagus irregularis]
MDNSSFESPQCNNSNELLCIPVRSLDAEIFGKPSKIGSIVNKKCRFLTFCRISRHPVIVQGCTVAHSNRCIETIRMSYCASLYDHWMPRYLAKRKILHNRKMKMPMFGVLPNISASSDRTEMHNSSFKSSHYDDSNELLCISVRSLDAVSD